MPDTTPSPSRWHQTLPAWLAVMVTLVIQIVVVSVWLASVRSDVDAAMEVNDRQQVQIEAVQSENQRMQIGAATVGAQLSAMRDSLSELKDGQRELIEELRRLSQGSKP